MDQYRLSPASQALVQSSPDVSWDRIPMGGVGPSIQSHTQSLLVPSANISGYSRDSSSLLSMMRQHGNVNNPLTLGQVSPSLLFTSLSRYILTFTQIDTRVNMYNSQLGSSHYPAPLSSHEVRTICTGIVRLLSKLNVCISELSSECTFILPPIYHSWTANSSQS